MRRRNLFLGMIAILFLGLVTGCEDKVQDDLNGNQEQAGKVVVKLTDAPFPSDLVEEANITVDWIKMGKSDEKNGSGNDEDSGFYTIELDENSTFNLLDLSNGVTAFLAEGEVPAGEYDEIRLHVVDAGIVLTDGTEYNLKVPSGNSSGLKLKIKPSLFIVKDAVSEVLLDFDVSRSFKAKGNIKKKINGFNFKPVVRAVNQTKSGEISGMVSDETDAKIKDALISLISGTDTITTALTSKEGYYAIIGVPEGEYTVACNKEGFEDQQVENVSVTEGGVTEQNFVLVAANEE